MKSLFTISAALLTCGSLMAQPTLCGGFKGMAGINGTAYTRTGSVPDTMGAYPFVCAAKDGRLFASSFRNDYLYYIDPATMKMTDSLRYSIYNITALNETNTMFARLVSGICRIDLATKTVADSVAITGVSSLAERPNSKEVWVVNDAKINVVNYSSGLVATPITLPAIGTSDAGEVAFTPGGTMAYKLSWTMNKVYKIDPNTKTITDSTIVTSSGSNMVVSRDSGKLFVTYPTLFRIRIYRTSDMALVDSIDNGTREPFDIYRHPTRNEIWVVNHFKDSVTVFDENTKAQLAAFDVSASPHGLAFGKASTTYAANTATTEAGVSIYPNPTTGAFTLRGITNEDLITVFDISSKAVKTLDPRSAWLNVAELVPGVYTVEVAKVTTHDRTAIQLLKQ